MPDEALRSLERAVLESPSPETRLRYGRALRRASRNDEARAVLLPAAGESAEVRREVGGLPAWTHFRADGGQSRWIDVPPVRAEPRLRWSRQLDAPFSDTLLASSLGVVLGSERRAVILDTATGRERRRLAAGLPPLLLEDLVLLPTRSMLVARELWTGKTAWTASQAAHPYTTTHADGRIVLGDRQGLVGLDVADSQRAPERRWVHPIRGGVWEGNPTHILMAGPLVVASCEASAPHVRVVLDALTGRERWRLTDCDMTLLDADGVLVRQSSLASSGTRESSLASSGTRGLADDAGPKQTCLHDRNGTLRWSAPGVHPSVLAPDYVVLEEPGTRRPSPDPREEGTTYTVWRQSGEPRGVLLREQVWGGPIAAARDVVYFGGYGSITAVTADGEHLWRTTLRQVRPETFILSLAPLPGALCGHTTDGTVFCLEDPGLAP